MRALAVDHRTEIKKNYFPDPRVVPTSSTIQYLFPNSIMNPVLSADVSGWGELGGTLSFVGGSSAVGPALTGLEAQRGYGRVSFPATAGALRVYGQLVAGYAPTNSYYLASVYVRGPAGKQIVLGIDEYDGGLNLIGATYAPAATLTGDWQQLAVARSWTQNAVPGSTALFNIYRATTDADAFSVDFKYAAFVATPYAVPFYGRTTGGVVLVERSVLTDSLLFEYAANTGTAIHAQGITGMVGTDAAMVPGLADKTPPAWTEYDNYSTTIFATSPITNESYMTIPNSLLGTTPGHRYTLAATGHLPAPRVFAESDNARRLMVRVTTPSGTTVSMSPQVPGLQGASATVKVSFDVPVGATLVEARVYNGGQYPNIMMWDSFSLWEGLGDWDYIDPDSRPFAFLGATNASPSVGIPTLGKQS